MGGVGANYAVQTARSVYEDFHADSIGEFVFFPGEDPMQIVLYNGNSRQQGELKLYFEGLFTEKWLNSWQNVRVPATLQDALKSYHHSNEGATIKTADHVRNADQVYGDILKSQVFPALSRPVQQFLIKSKSFIGALGNVLYHFHQEKHETPDWNLETMYHSSNRSASRKYSKVNGGAWSLTNYQRDCLAQALSDYYAVLSALKIKLEKSDTYKNFSGSSGLFQFFIMEFSSDSKALSMKSINSLATKMFNKASKILMINETLLNGSNMHVAKNCMQLRTLLDL